MNQIFQTATRKKSGTHYLIPPTAGDPFRITALGRDEWTLDQLREAGRKGCTPITQPAPRWSAYIHNLRKLSVEIETITEPHDGDFPARHARYVLRPAACGITERGQA